MSDSAFPILAVEDLDAARRFYERLGFSVTYQFPPDGPPGYLTMERAGSALGLSGSTDGERFSYWVYVDDVDQAVADLRADGWDVEGEPRDEPWGERVARVRDPAGHLVHVGAPIGG